MNKRQSNEEFVNELMTFSKYGVLAQVFPIEALRYYSELVSGQPKPTEAGNGLVSPIVWHNIATDVNKALKENYEM